MKRGFRYQTGEIADIADEIRIGNIPEVDIENDDEYKEVLEDLKQYNIHLLEEVGANKNAVSTVDFPEFQFRTAFFIDGDKTKICYIDFYTIEPPEETYADVFGD